MIRARSEGITFTRDDLELIVRHMAQSQIAGSNFIGKFGEQSVKWLPDGGIEVVTTYVQGEYADLPGRLPEDTTTKALPKRRR